MTHSLDYREEVVRAHAECGSSVEVAESHHCSESWVRRMTQQMRQTGSVAPKSSARLADQHTYPAHLYGQGRGGDPQAHQGAARDATLAEVAEAIGKPASLSTVCRTLQRLAPPRENKVDARCRAGPSR